jgi:hypothetical protein
MNFMKDIALKFVKILCWQKTKTTLYSRLLLQAKRPLRLGASLGQARRQQEGRHQRLQQQNERGDRGSLVLLPAFYVIGAKNNLQ